MKGDVVGVTVTPVAASPDVNAPTSPNAPANGGSTTAGDTANGVRRR